ncbi:MAG TPA: AAA family ATPase [Candidatus Binatia bacterium]
MSHGYSLDLPALGINFVVDRFRREHHELIGELTVKCALPGARTVNGCLSVGDFNFSSIRARQDRAKLLAQRANTNGKIDWYLLLEDLAQNVIQAERTGEPAVDLRTLSRPERDELQVEGLAFPRRHPTILFGDGGSAKSYIALYLAGRLQQSGINVCLFDWELCGEDHRDRLERLFGSAMPKILYVRCERPLIYEADRLRRVVTETNIGYAIFDSIAFACDGPPEAAEIAGKYFRALREINCGSLHVAHVTKSDNNDQRPFGSAFWHNGARSTWYVQAVEPNEHNLRLGLFNRKANLGALRPAVSYFIQFDDECTSIRRVEITDSQDLTDKLSVRTRIFLFLQRGSRTTEEIAESISADLETVKRTLRRYRNDFVVLDGGRIGIREKSA